MTQPPDPTPPPPVQPYPPGYVASPPRRPRPRVVWFVVGGALVVLAPLVFVGSLVLVLSPMTREDAVFPVGQGPTVVELPAGEERALFTEDRAPVSCTATDGTGAEVELRPVAGDFSYNEWQALARFDTGDGSVSFECQGLSGQRVRVAQLPSTGGFVGGLLAGLGLPLVLGLTGLVVLVVTGIRWATGVPRER